MRTIAEIDADISKVKAEMLNVHGTDTEVYARIVGYYRSVRNWNRGKREEFGIRKLFLADEGRIHAHLPASSCGCDAEPAYSAQGDSVSERYELYVRKTCPNCPPVKECCANLPISGEQIDVDSAEGFARASKYGVVSAPTAIFFDADGNEIGRAHSVKEIRSLASIVRAAEAAPALF